MRVFVGPSFIQQDVASRLDHRGVSEALCWQSRQNARLQVMKLRPEPHPSSKLPSHTPLRGERLWVGAGCWKLFLMYLLTYQ